MFTLDGRRTVFWEKRVQEGVAAKAVEIGKEVRRRRGRRMRRLLGMVIVSIAWKNKDEEKVMHQHT